jgi:hypothetical protein
MKFIKFFTSQSENNMATWNSYSLKQFAVRGFFVKFPGPRGGEVGGEFCKSVKERGGMKKGCWI